MNVCMILLESLERRCESVVNLNGKLLPRKIANEMVITRQRHENISSIYHSITAMKPWHTYLAQRIYMYICLYIYLYIIHIYRYQMIVYI